MLKARTISAPLAPVDSICRKKEGKANPVDHIIGQLCRGYLAAQLMLSDISGIVFNQLGWKCAIDRLSQYLIIE